MGSAHEGVVGQTVQEGRLADDLVDRMLDGWSTSVWDGVEVECFKSSMGSFKHTGITHIEL